MGNIADHPVPRPVPIDANAATEILTELLAIERVRLAQAVEMEKTRKIVFPETTVIIKDVERLVAILAGRNVADAPREEPVGDAEAELQALLRSIE